MLVAMPTRGTRALVLVVALLLACGGEVEQNQGGGPAADQAT
jgi:hypothetical protein